MSHPIDGKPSPPEELPAAEPAVPRAAPAAPGDPENQVSGAHEQELQQDPTSDPPRAETPEADQGNSSPETPDGFVTPQAGWGSPSTLNEQDSDTSSASSDEFLSATLRQRQQSFNERLAVLSRAIYLPSPGDYDSSPASTQHRTQAGTQVRPSTPPAIHNVLPPVHPFGASKRRRSLSSFRNFALTASLQPATMAPDPPKPKEVSPPTLSDVDPIKWVTFHKAFSRVALLNQWSDDRAKLMLQTSLQDAAARAVEHVTFRGSDKLQDAIDKLSVIFINPASTQLYKTKFKDASRSPGEELIMWHTRVREMFMRAYPQVQNQEENEDLKERFVLGLRNRSLTQTLLSAENYTTMTFTELLTRAQNLQGSLLQCQRSYPDVAAIRSPGNGSSTTASAIAAINGSGNRKSSNVTCYHCDRPGHVISECRNFEKARARIAKNPRMYMQPLASRSSSSPRGSGYRGRGSSTSRGRGTPRGRSSHRGSNPRQGSRPWSTGDSYPVGLAAMSLEDNIPGNSDQSEHPPADSREDTEPSYGFSDPLFPETSEN